MHGHPSQEGPSKTADSGVSLIRTGDAAALLRKRFERPARVGRYILSLLGSITAAAGVADWLTTRSEVGLALGLFGAVLIALGVAQHYLYRRDLEHWPTDVLLWNEGIELVLANGEVRGAMWSDPDFALQLVARRVPPPAGREFLLLWLTDPKIPQAEITADGFDRLTKTAGEWGLRIVQIRRGSRPDATQMLHIQQKAATKSSKIVKTAETKG